MNREDIENLVNTDFEKMQIIVNRIFKEEYVKKIEQENSRLKEKNKKAIDKLEFYNSGEALWYVPIQEIIDILKEN